MTKFLVMLCQLLHEIDRQQNSRKLTAGGYTLTVSRTTGSGVPGTKHDRRSKAEPGASSTGIDGGCIAGPRVRVERLVRRLKVGCLGRVVAAEASRAWLACPAAKPTPRLLIPRKGWNEDAFRVGWPEGGCEGPASEGCTGAEG
jgi:hypothetical protein